ncbi:MAG TPA: signal recognition particle-docking protein FtsY [Bacillota bacterium]|jgi:fused signal recognition particle receptor|nr:signal recognition particle-docking protein FtsY [Bacillota bacterium]HOL09860.1 signal recognition particle-docking protein FtsY [Bacillota bacterium]HPO97580.1 signal recognition particle-docking protein FtsY [Bacillota bacterium]
MGLNFFAKLKEGLAKTKANLVENLEGIFSLKKIDDEFYTELEDSLIMADVGVETTTYLIDRLKKAVKEQNITEPFKLKEVLVGEITAIFKEVGSKPFNFETKNKVYLIIGVNGVGKTTTIAKLAAKFKDAKRQVLLVAGDTFRAAATEQLVMWGERINVPVIHHQEGADPAAVVFDGMAAGKARKSDIIIIDTAGRLHTKVNLMEELKKVKRIVNNNLDQYTLETIMVVDATTGQNAVNQTKVFHEALGIDQLIITKLDGTAKGGIIISIANQLRIPIGLIGVGEKAEDLQEFDAELFTKALFE